MESCLLYDDGDGDAGAMEIEPGTLSVFCGTLPMFCGKQILCHSYTPESALVFWETALWVAMYTNQMGRPCITVSFQFHHKW